MNDSCFAATYDEAREKFLTAARDIGATLHTISYREDDVFPWEDRNQEVIDVAILGNVKTCRG